MEGFSVFTAKGTKPDDIINDMGSPVVLNLSEYCAATNYSVSEVQVFSKQLKHLTDVQYVVTQKQ
jgi:hypothetical protein